MYNFCVLQQKRSVMDVDADKFVKQYLGNGCPRGMGSRIVDLFSGRVFDENQSADLQEKVLNLPAWVDLNRIKQGQKVFTQYGPEISMLLMFKSLPECYACGNGVNVLYQTGKFTYEDDARLFSKRLLDTATFVQDVLTEGSSEGEKGGLRSILKIRTIHATARQMVLKRDIWDTQKYGQPINQEDMLGTLMAFSISVLQGLERLGARLSVQETEDFYYVWRIAGEALGIERDMIPINVDEGYELSNCIMSHQMGGTPEGDLLLKSIIRFVDDKLMLPGFSGGAVEVMKSLIDEKVIQTLPFIGRSNILDKAVPKFLRFGVLIRHKLAKILRYQKVTLIFNQALLAMTLIYFTFLGKGKKHIFDFS